MRTFHRIASLAIGAGFTARLGLAIFPILAMSVEAQTLHAANITYVVGTCKGNSPYKTIQSALDASPAANTVEVCPALYGEQIIIHKPVTLEGIEQGNQAQVRVVTPANGFTNNTTIPEFPGYAAAQIYVDHVNGAVNLTNLVLNGQASGEGHTGVNFVGVLYDQSGGTISQVTTEYQNGEGVMGWGMVIEGGNSQSPVVVENCSIHDFTSIGILVSAEQNAPELHVTINNNVISPGSAGGFGVQVDADTDATISGNTINGGDYGILNVSSKASITGNKVIGPQIGIGALADGVSVTSNSVLDAAQVGIVVGRGVKVSSIENNLISSVASSDGQGGTGIELLCTKVTSTQVHSNTIMDADYGYGDAPAGFGGGNNYFGVLFKTSTCTTPLVSPQAKAASLSALGPLRQQ